MNLSKTFAGWVAHWQAGGKRHRCSCENFSYSLFFPRDLCDSLIDAPPCFQSIGRFALFVTEISRFQLFHVQSLAAVQSLISNGSNNLIYNSSSRRGGSVNATESKHRLDSTIFLDTVFSKDSEYKRVRSVHLRNFSGFNCCPCLACLIRQ